MQQLLHFLVNNIFHTLQKQQQTMFICCCVLLSPLILHGQAYPVDCRVLLSPPYSGNWTDYANSPTKFRVQLLLRDLTKTSLDVSLRIRLKSAAGVWIENPEGFIASNPISLSPGVPRILSGAELFDNFNPNNLEAQGIDLNALYQGEVLPVGPYQWEVFAVELYRNRQVSNIGSARMNLNANYAPLLNMPRNEAVLTPSQPQNILFSWTPRHTASPALGVKYTLFLYEISDDDNIQAVVNSSIAPFRIIETTQSNYLYGATEVPLQAGKRYAWQVKIEDLQGKEVFQNDGFSNIQSFSYGKLPCLAPENLVSEVETENDKPTGAVKFSWKEVQGMTENQPIAYILTYNQESGLPTEVRTTKPEYLLLQQEVGKNYEWKVQSVCGVGDKSAFSSIESFNIPTPEPESWYSDPNLSYQEEPTPKADPDVMRTKEDEVGDNEKDPLSNLFEQPISILIPSSDTSSKTSPSELTILPPNPTIEQLQVALKAKKPTCTGIVSNYSCGNHDTTPDYGGTIVPTNTGDDIAMNSHVITVISIDGEGNGSGLIKIPMMNNIKLGITLTGIKVAEGGCIVAGKAELSGISASVLNDELRTKLEKAYAVYKQIINAGISNADVIAKGINDAIESINNLTAKIWESKSHTKALLETDTLNKEETLLKNCTDISTDSRILQDSLEAIICKMKTGKLKGNISKLEKASQANIAFMNKLEPALAQCQNKTIWENWEQKPCKGPCDFDVDYSIFDCKSELRTVFGVKEESIKNYHVSIDIATEKWLDGEGKTFYKTYIDCDVKETKEWTRFDVNLNNISQGQIYPFEVNSNLPNQSSYEASKKELPMAGEWGNSIFSIASGKIDDYIFLGRVLNFCPNVIKQVKQPWLRPFNGAIATAKTADFAEKTKTITEWIYAIVDGYYICKSIGAAAWRLAKGRATVGRQTWNGFANIFKANTDEILEATNKIKNYRITNNLSGKNCGYIEGTVNGKSINNKIWLSGEAKPEIEPQIFKAINVEGGSGRTWLRNTDSEYKMLNKLADDLGGVAGSVKVNITGEIKIVSELPYCASCKGIIQQFNEMFPNIKLILVDGAK